MRIPTGQKKLFFNNATQKLATLVPRGIANKMVPTWPIFEKCSHLREKGGVLTKIWHSRNRLSRTVARWCSSPIRFLFVFVLSLLICIWIKDAHASRPRAARARNTLCTDFIQHPAVHLTSVRWTSEFRYTCYYGTCGAFPCVCMLLQNSQNTKGARSV
jgi:hypothetical protein